LYHIADTQLFNVQAQEEKSEHMRLMTLLYEGHPHNQEGRNSGQVL
jgi:hypothetical protein